MIILDTNVVSELIKPAMDHQVKVWMDRYDIEQLYITSITLMEIECGICLLPDGKKRTALGASFQFLLKNIFHDRIKGFGAECGLLAGELDARLKGTGYTVDIRDIQIAAIVRHHGAVLATRNTKDFKDCDIRLINPWAQTDLD